MYYRLIISLDHILEDRDYKHFTIHNSNPSVQYPQELMRAIKHVIYFILNKKHFFLSFKYTILQYIIYILHHVLTTQSLISFCQRIFDPLYPLQPPSTPSPLITAMFLSAITVFLDFSSHPFLSLLSFCWLSSLLPFVSSFFLRFFTCSWTSQHWHIKVTLCMEKWNGPRQVYFEFQLSLSGGLYDLGWQSFIF